MEEKLAFKRHAYDRMRERAVNMELRDLMRQLERVTALKAKGREEEAEAVKESLLSKIEVMESKLKDELGDVKQMERGEFDKSILPEGKTIFKSRAGLTSGGEVRE